MYGILKKKYGQNFLIDKNILNKISKLISNESLKIIEIGPGDGRLSEFILKRNPKNLTLIEIDHDLISSLNSKFFTFKNVKILNKDILKHELNESVDLIISNLPYNISSQILVKICLLQKLPNKLIFMFQKEFANRLIDKKLNSLNSLVNCFYNIDYNFNVSKQSFRPIPKVESSVLSFSKKSKVLLNDCEIKNFIEFKRNLFSYKRKKIGKILKNYNLKNEIVDVNERVENLSLSQLLKLFREINI